MRLVLYYFFMHGRERERERERENCLDCCYIKLLKIAVYYSNKLKKIKL